MRYVLFALGLAALLQTPDIRFEKALPDEQLNQTFMNREGWIGGDGAFSVPIGRDSSWWLFSDTWIGKIEGRARTGATIVNNTAGRLDGTKLTFIVRGSNDGGPQALVTPAEGAGWFWLGSGALIDRKLYVFLSQIVKTDASSVFGFKAAGLWLGVCASPGLDPESWKFKQLRVPFARFDARREVSFGFSLCLAGSWMYIYGTDEDVSPSWRARFLLVARCPALQIAEFSTWRFWTGTAWSADPAACARTVDHMASDGSVSYLPRLKRFVLVYTEDGLSSRILARTSKSPEGPWSSPTEVYRCPEGADKGVFCYQARNHPELAHGNELAISYCTNSFGISQVLRDTRLYFPRFVRVKLAR